MNNLRAVAVACASLAIGLAVGLSIPPAFIQREESQRVSPESVPECGTFWSLQNSDWPPMPCNPFPDLPVYSLGDGSFLIDDSTVDYEALSEDISMPQVSSQLKSGFSLMDIEGEDSGAPAFRTPLTTCGSRSPGCRATWRCRIW